MSDGWSLKAALNGEVETSYEDDGIPHDYHYEDVVEAFLWAAGKRDLGISEELRAMADLFERATYCPVNEGRFESRREAWLALGYLVEGLKRDFVYPVLTDEERAAAEEIVSTDPLRVGRAVLRVGDLPVEAPGEYEIRGPDGEVVDRVTAR